MHAYHKLIVRFAQTRLGSTLFVHVFCPIDKRLIRWTNGALSTTIGTGFRDNTVLLSCTGARSGQRREVPLLATPLDGQFVLVAAAGGQEKNPGWYFNLKANPNCSLLMRGRNEIACVAHEAEAEERERAWAAANAQYPGYAKYNDLTERRVPVMIVTPLPS